MKKNLPFELFYGIVANECESILKNKELNSINVLRQISILRVCILVCESNDFTISLILLELIGIDKSIIPPIRKRRYELLLNPRSSGMSKAFWI